MSKTLGNYEEHRNGSNGTFSQNDLKKKFHRLHYELMTNLHRLYLQQVKLDLRLDLRLAGGDFGLSVKDLQMKKRLKSMPTNCQFLWLFIINLN